MFDKTILLLALASIAERASGQLNWSKTVSITNPDACAEVKKSLFSTCYEIIFSRTVEEIILKGKCAIYKVNWSGNWSPWYKCSRNDHRNRPCHSFDCMISSNSDDDCAGPKPSWGNVWKVSSYRRWDKIILKGKITAFKVKMNGSWSIWYNPKENEEEK